MSLLISDIPRDIDLHSGGTHHSNQSEITLCAKGEGGGLHEKFSEIDFLLFLIEETEIYQILLVP